MDLISLASRQQEYEVPFDYIITRRLPIIIRCDGKNFSRVCHKLNQPYDPDFSEAIVGAAIKTISDMDGAILGYQQSDEITFVLRNDLGFNIEPWYNNHLQEIVSVVSSLFTWYFREEVVKYNLDIDNKCIFRTKVFSLPNLSEVVNNLISRQQECLREAISKATYSDLRKKFGKNATEKLIVGKTKLQKIELLQEHCGIDFYQSYSNVFRNGVGIYKVPVLNPSKNIVKKKWTIDWSFPDLIKERNFINNIIVNGCDVVRANNIEN